MREEDPAVDRSEGRAAVDGRHEIRRRRDGGDPVEAVDEREEQKPLHVVDQRKGEEAERAKAVVAGEQLAIVVAVGEPARGKRANDVHRAEECDRARRGHLGEAVLDRVRDEVRSDEAVRRVAADEEARREEPEIAGPRGLAKRRRP